MNFVKRLEVEGLFGMFYFDQPFGNSPITVLYGKNGAGKTMILRILANALSGNHYRFAYIEFRRIQIEMKNGSKLIIERTENKKDRSITITSSMNGEKIQRSEFHFSGGEMVSENTDQEWPSDWTTSGWRPGQIEPILLVSYFPSFRDQLNAWEFVLMKEIKRIHLDEPDSNIPAEVIEIEIGKHEVESEDKSIDPTELMKFARKIHGQFLPDITYPSIVEIQREIVKKINARESRHKLPAGSVEGLRKEDNEIIENFLKSVNPFLDGKKLTLYLFESDLRKSHLDIFTGLECLEENASPLKVRFDKGGGYEQLHVLSSGERQLVSILFAASQAEGSTLMLIDEPEISLHVEWQDRLLASIKSIKRDVQVIVCTHSKVILDKYYKSAYEVKLSKWEYRRLLTIDEFKEVIKEGKKKYILVEGPSDKMAIESLLQEFGVNEDKFDIYFASEIEIPSMGGLGVKEKVEKISKLIGTESYAKRFVGFSDREFGGFNPDGRSIVDLLEGHKLDGRLLWSRGHSIENYFFNESVLQETFKNILTEKHTEQSMKIISLFKKSLESTMQLGCALSLAASSPGMLEAGMITKAEENIGWNILRINDSCVEIDFEKWRPLGISQGEIEKFIESTDIYREQTKRTSLDVNRYCCHGHIGFKLIWAVFERCILDVTENDKFRDAVSQIPDKTERLARVWAKKALENKVDYPKEIFDLLEIA